MLEMRYLPEARRKRVADPLLCRDCIVVDIPHGISASLFSAKTKYPSSFNRLKRVSISLCWIVEYMLGKNTQGLWHLMLHATNDQRDVSR
jgi:hypothetical protein